MIRIGIPVRCVDGHYVRCVDEHYVVNASYIEALVKAKAEPVIITSYTDLETLIPTLNGILIPGGPDVDPSFYHEPNLHCGTIDHQTDELDLALFKAARKAKLEIFGICRGLQIINIALGGSLIQDIPIQVKSKVDHITSFYQESTTQGHTIRIDPNSRLAQRCPLQLEVNSYHHQAIKKLAEGLSVSAQAEDGVIEAIEADQILAVQWHPERMISDPIFQDLFDDFIRRCSL